VDQLITAKCYGDFHTKTVACMQVSHVTLYFDFLVIMKELCRRVRLYIVSLTLLDC